MKVGMRPAKLALVGMIGWAAAFAPLVATAHAAGAITPLSITTTSPLPAGTQLSSYSTTIAATGGTSPYTFFINTGTLPTGLTLDSSGLLSGTPQSAGTSTFSVKVKDSGGSQATKSFSLTINPQAPLTPVHISNDTLPNGSTSSYYDEDVFATGGTGDYDFSLVSGKLPPGISLSDDGDLEGCPTVKGTFKFVVQATDGNTTDTHVEFITIS